MTDQERINEILARAESWQKAQHRERRDEAIATSIAFGAFVLAVICIVWEVRS